MKNETHPGAFGFIAGLWFMFGVLLALQLACGHASQMTRGVPRTDTKRADATVVVDALCVLPGGVMTGARGSGALIGPSRVLTAYHVVECKGALIVNVRDASGRESVGILERAWRDRDVATVRTATVFPVETPPIAQLGVSEICVYSASPARERQCGRFIEAHTMFCPNFDWCHNFTMSNRVERGNSGSAIYDARGALVGVATGTRYVSPRIGYASSLWDIRGELTD